MELVILIGIQGAGKTTFYRSQFAGTHVHVSKDRLRHNRRPERRQRQLMLEALREGRSVVVDNTNPRRSDREPLIALAREQGARVIGYFFDSSYAECSARNQARLGRERVPEVALRTALKRLEAPTRAEGFDELYFVRCAPGGGFEVLAWQEQGRDPTTP